MGARRLRRRRGPQAKTGQSYVYKSAVFGHYGALDPQAIFRQNVLSHPQNPADSVVVFAKNDPTVNNGGSALDAFGKSVDTLTAELQSMPGEDASRSRDRPSAPRVYMIHRLTASVLPW